MRYINKLIPLSDLPLQDAKQDIKEIEQQLKLSNDLPFLGLLNDNKTIITKNDSLIQILKIEGRNFICSTNEELKDIFREKKLFISNLRPDFEYCFLHFHRKSKKLFKINKSEDEIINEITSKWEKNFEDLHVTEKFLVVSLKSSKIINFSSKKAEISRNEKEEIFTRHRKLNSHILNLVESLRKFKVSVARDEELLKIYDYVLNPYEHDDIRNSSSFTKNKAPLSDIYARSDIEFNKKGIIKYNSNNNEKYSSIISFKDYSESTSHDILDEILSNKIEFLLYQNIVPQTKESAKKSIIKRKESLEKMPLSEFESENINNLHDAVDAVVNGKENFFLYDFSLQIYANSKSDLEEKTTKIEGALARKGIITLREEGGIRLKFLSVFPELHGMNARLSHTSLSNISDIVNLSNTAEGLTKSAFGNSPVTYFKTDYGNQYNFTFHKDDKADSQGNTLVIGETGSGKTVLVSFLIQMALNQHRDLRVLGFDSKEGLKIPTTFFKGKYTKYGEDKNLNLNPFQLSDNYANRTFLEKFIEILSDGLEEFEKDIVSDAVRQNYNLSESSQSLCAIESLFHVDDEVMKRFNPNKRNLHDRLQKWIPDESNSRIHGGLFNAKKDVLEFDNRQVVFDMELALKNEEVLYPLASYIFHKFSQKVQEEGAPHIILIDEMAQYLRNDIFAEYIKEHVQQARKKKGMFLGMVQELSALTATKTGEQILENLSTVILFPNQKVTEEYKTRLQLTENEFNWLKNSNRAGIRHQVMVKNMNRPSVILDVNLECLGSHFKVLSSDITLQKKYKNLFGTENWRREYLKVSV